jgi:hypothetical protein
MKKYLVLCFVIIFLVGTLSAIEYSYCCEKTTNGAWCQNSPIENCDANFKREPTSCESTSYCSLGCCYDSSEGTCMGNTPELVCSQNNGVWSGESASCNIPQCQLGCCVIGDQAAFVTMARCKRLATIYGVEVDYRTSIASEMMCIASVSSDVKGACVYEEDFERTCKMSTKRECNTLKNNNPSAEFHEGYLCTSEELNTICAKTSKTTCVENVDQVYFLDSCGNLANVYDSSKVQDPSYWEKIINLENSCGYGSSNANSASCGNCDYYFGSTCKKYNSGQDKTKPSVGENICRDLGCTYDGKIYEHGETWCATGSGTSTIGTTPKLTNSLKENLPGSRYFRLVCYNGEVSVEPCADFRNEICLESEVNGFSSAGCVVNRWQDCALQDNQRDCQNYDKRDCQWIISQDEKQDEESVACVPRYSPGQEFWNGESGTSEEVCSIGTSTCIVTYTKKLGGDWECSENCECLEQAWIDQQNKVCTSLGDCGVQINYLGVQGYLNESKQITTSKKK